MYVRLLHEHLNLDFVVTRIRQSLNLAPWHGPGDVFIERSAPPGLSPLTVLSSSRTLVVEAWRSSSSNAVPGGQEESEVISKYPLKSVKL